MRCASTGQALLRSQRCTIAGGNVAWAEMLVEAVRAAFPELHMEVHAVRQPGNSMIVRRARIGAAVSPAILAHIMRNVWQASKS